MKFKNVNQVSIYDERENLLSINFNELEKLKEETWVSLSSDGEPMITGAIYFDNGNLMHDSLNDPLKNDYDNYYVVKN